LKVKEEEKEKLIREELLREELLREELYELAEQNDVKHT
jgi:hypothetical protein